MKSGVMIITPQFVTHIPGDRIRLYPNLPLHNGLERIEAQASS